MAYKDPYDDLNKDGLARARPSRAPWVLLVLALLAGAGASMFLLARLDRARTEARAATTQVTDANARLGEERNTRAELNQRLEKMEADKADLLALKNQLSLQVQSKEEEIAKLQGTYQELEQKLQAEIKKGDIRLSQSGGRIKVDLVDKILFDVGDASITRLTARIDMKV